MTRRYVGIREAKECLSQLLRDVERGDEVVITNRTRAIGKIVPVSLDDLSLSLWIKNLENERILEPIRDKKVRGLPPPLPIPHGIAQRFLEEDRSE